MPILGRLRKFKHFYWVIIQSFRTMWNQKLYTEVNSSRWVGSLSTFVVGTVDWVKDRGSIRTTLGEEFLSKVKSSEYTKKRYVNSLPYMIKKEKETIRILWSYFFNYLHIQTKKRSWFTVTLKKYLILLLICMVYFIHWSYYAVYLLIYRLHMVSAFFTLIQTCVSALLFSIKRKF